MSGPDDDDLARRTAFGRSRPSRVRRTRHSWHPWLPSDHGPAAQSPSASSPQPSPHEPHGGNEPVNERPDEQSLGSGLGPDEAELRRLLHQAVDVLEPSDDTLDYLRHAVPARRARKRQALVGMAAAALFAGTAVPAAVHVSTAGSAKDVRAGSASGGTEVQGGQGDDLHTGVTAGTALPGLPGVTDDVGSRGGDSKGGKDAGADASAPASAPTCTAAQLSAPVGELGPVGADGSVSGVFRVYNSSIAGCSVSDPGTVSVSALGAADPARIAVVRQAGDQQEYEQLLLAPGNSYEIRVSWVASGSCPTDDPVESPTTSGGTDGGGGDAAGGQDGGTSAPPTVGGSTDGRVGSTGNEGTEDGVSTQLGKSQANADGSVVVSYRPQGADAAGAAASVTVPGACAGTVYRTGILAGS